MLCEDCIHKYVCRKVEGYQEAYTQNGLILPCGHFRERDMETRIKTEAKKMLEKIIEELNR